MSYQQLTLSQFVADISANFNDSNNVHWTVAEITDAINEALLCWGGLTSYWQERAIFNTAVNTGFYDLSVEVPNLRSRAITFDQLARSIQFALYEPSTGVAGTGMTPQFSIGEIISALGRARNNFIIDSRLPLTLLDLAVPAPPAGRAELPSSTSLLSHVYWQDGPSGIFTPLRRLDAWSEQAYNPIWTIQQDTPFAYSTAETPVLQIQLYPIPIANGAISAIAAETVDYNANPITNTTTLGLPDEFSMAVKYGALDSILSVDSEAYDPLRDQYAKSRYESLVEAARATMRSALRVQLQNVPLPLDTLHNLDALRPSWRNQNKRPDFAACVYDILAFSPTPNAAYSISCDLSRSAPLPVNGADFIQVGPEEIPYLFSYVQHILSFKLGGNEFSSTFDDYDSFLKGAKQRNGILTARAQYLSALFGQPKKEASELVPA